MSKPTFEGLATRFLRGVVHPFDSQRGEAYRLIVKTLRESDDRGHNGEGGIGGRGIEATCRSSHFIVTASVSCDTKIQLSRILRTKTFKH